MRRTFITAFIFVILFTVSPGYCLADQTSPTSLTVEEAVNLALSNSKDLKQASLGVDAAEITRDKTWDSANAALMSTYVPGTDLYISIPTSSDESSVYSTNYSYLSKLSSYNTKKETITIAVHQKFYDILDAIDSVASKRLTSEQNTEKLRIAQLRCQLGLDTNATLYQTQLQSSSSQADLASAQKTLDKKYTEFMQYLGLPADSRPALNNNVTYTPAKIDNVDTAIDSIVDNSPAIYLANEAVKVQKNTSGSSGSYKLDKDNLDSANLSVDITRDEMETSVRSIYYQIRALEDSYQAFVASKQSADESLRVTNLMYEVGMATKVDVMTAESAACTAQNSLNSLIRNHEILKMDFTEPWAASN